MCRPYLSNSMSHSNSACCNERLGFQGNACDLLCASLVLARLGFTEFSSQEDSGPDSTVKVASVVHALSPGVAQVDRHIVLAERLGALAKYTRYGDKSATI